MEKGLKSELHADRLDRSRKVLEGHLPDDDKSQRTQTAAKDKPNQTSAETGGPSGPEPTRYGDWEKKGRCIDF